MKMLVIGFILFIFLISISRIIIGSPDDVDDGFDEDVNGTINDVN